MNDAELLNQYAAHRSQEAFALIVRRYAGLVHSSARRQLGDAHAAEDVTQAVFLTLAKKAASFPPDVVLSSWLLTATRYAASNARVIAARRVHHESRAASMAAKHVDDSRDAGWDDIAPALDEALAELPEAHRDALALRFFDGKTLREVAAALRITEDAAKQRVSRAVRQLRSALGARGVTVSLDGLAGSLVTHAVPAAPSTVIDATVAAVGHAAEAIPWVQSVAAIGRRGVDRVVVRSLVAAATVLAAGAILIALGTGDTAPPAPRGIVYAVPGTETVNVRRDQNYRQIDGGNQLWFDTYTPPGSAPAIGWPVVVLIHGGPVPLTSHPKDWPPFQAYGRVLAASGVAAVTFNYRFTSPGDFGTGASDIAALLSHLRSHSRDLGIDGDRMCLWAFSGGGPQLATALRDRPPYVKCLVSFYAPLDTPTGQSSFSPLAQLRTGDAKTPPMFIARMGRDSPPINASVDAFGAEAIRRGAAVEIVDYPEGIHAFDIDQDTDASRDVIAKAVAFVKKHLLTGDGVPTATTSRTQ